MTSCKRVKSGEILLDPSVDFPEMIRFEDPNKLPSKKSIIGVMKYLTNPKEVGKIIDIQVLF